jgi:hypothetical protein
MEMIHRYIMIAVFGFCLLIGIQAPNFIDQYAKRIDAHYLEVEENLRGFQAIADRFHGGDLAALIAKHRSSRDSTFAGEAEPIERMAARKARFAKEREALRTGFSGRVAHVLIGGDREILAETYSAYERDIRLDKQAVLSGLAAAVAICLLLESLFGLGKRLLGPSRTRQGF